MSFLKNILVELQNCVHDEHEDDMPVVWSRDIQHKLKKNTDHWNNVGNGGGLHTSAEEEEDAGAFGGIQRRGFDDEDEMDLPTERNYRDRYGDYEDDDEDRMVDIGDDDDFMYDDDDDFDYPTFRNHADRYGYEEEETASAPVTKWTQKYLSKNAEEKGECPDCFGTGDQFPDMTTDCETCGGTGDLQDRPKNAPMGFRDYVSQEEQEEDDVDMDVDVDVNPDEEDPTNRAVDDQYGLDDPNDEEEDTDFEDAVDQEWEDPDYQGVIRTVPNAHLVYKRQQEDGTFNELWQYNLTGSDFKEELETRRAILAGTDIPINKMKSPDNEQSYELWTAGNGQLLMIRGLPN